MKNLVTRIRINFFIALSMTLWVIAASHNAHALAKNDDAIIEGAKQCTNYLPRQERQYGIPVHLLAAIATTESGRYQSQLGMSLPWPWTINVEGKGYFYDTKEEAVAAVKDFQGRGFKSIDVGCMQVNLHHHPKAFASIEEAFDPAYNIAYAAGFLKRNFDEEGSWRKATADYHSHTSVFGDPYAGLVFNHWSRIINKVADARAGKLVLRADPVKSPVKYAESTSRPAARSSYHGVHMHSISVSSGTSTENGVIIIRPEKSVVQVASANERIDNKFVIRIPHKRDIENAKKEPDTKTTAKNEEKMPKAKGQFEGSKSSLMNASSNAASESTRFKPSSTFVFDN